jgi:hypothetical protein
MTDRQPTLGGGSYPAVGYGDGPHRSFVRNIAKLNTKSPMGEGGSKSLGGLGLVTAPVPRTQKILVSVRPLNSKLEIKQIKQPSTKSSRPGGPVKSLRDRWRRTGVALTRRFFLLPPELFRRWQPKFPSLFNKRCRRQGHLFPVAVARGAVKTLGSSDRGPAGKDKKTGAKFREKMFFGAARVCRAFALEKIVA